MSEMAWIRPVVAGPRRGFSSEAGFYTSVQEKIPFPMLFRLHMRIYVESHNLDSAASIGGSTTRSARQLSRSWHSWLHELRGLVVIRRLLVDHCVDR